MVHDGVPAAAPATPRWRAQPPELDDLECLLLGAYGSLDGFVAPADLPDAGPPVAPTLVVPAPLAADAVRAGELVVLDEEDVPVARVLVTAAVDVPPDRSAPGAAERAVVGRVLPERASHRGTHRGLRRPAQRAAVGDLLGVPVRHPPSWPELVATAATARQHAQRVLLLPLTGHGSPQVVDASALVRASVGAVDVLRGLGVAAEVVPVPVPAHDQRGEEDLAAWVAAAYGATTVVGPSPGAAPPRTGWVTLPEVRLAHDGLHWVVAAAGDGADAGKVRPGEVTSALLAGALAGDGLPAHLLPEASAREVRRTVRPGGGRGCAVLLTGLSGSGKSTIARALAAALLERSDRTVTLLDGDVVRRLLSAGLTFSRADRDLNVRRLGFVAAEVARHGGVAICAPIAPYASTRAQVRAMVEEHGGFLLVHVSTALEVCEARDRKGLYARARTGELPHFTGISDPYEEPADADLRLDSSVVEVSAAVEQLLAALTDRGWLRGLVPVPAAAG